MGSFFSAHSAPALPHFLSVSGILGELGYMSIGVGYTIPFQMFAAPWVEAEKLARNLNGLNVPGIVFRPMYLKPFYSVGKGELLQGVQVHIMDFGKAPLSEIQFLVMQEVAALYPDRAVFDHADKGRFAMFDKVSGSKQIRERFSKRNRWEDIRDYWYKDVEGVSVNCRNGIIYINNLTSIKNGKSHTEYHSVVY